MAEKHVIDMFRSNVRRLDPDSSPDICISKIHDTYVPQKIGLGLFHHSDPLNNRQIMNGWKQQALNKTFGGIYGMTEKGLVQGVLKELTNIKNYYKDSSEYFKGIAEFDQARYFALDACFIIQFYTSDNNDVTNDGILRNSIIEDIFMFQNQVPLFLLLKIMELGCEKEEAVNRLANSLARYQPFQTLLPFAISTKGEIIKFMKIELRTCCHLLHLLNKCIKHFLSPDPDTYTPAGTRSPVTSLNYYNLERLDTYRVEFNARNREVCFEKTRWWKSGTLHLPQIRLDEATAPVHRNLMNFARLTRQDKLICDLMFLMKCIVQERNEGLFRKRGIIQGNGERFFEKILRLCDGVTDEASMMYRYEQTINDLEEHCNAPFNEKLCSVRDFFKRRFSLPLVVSILSLVVAILSLAFGIINRPKR